MVSAKQNGVRSSTGIVMANIIRIMQNASRSSNTLKTIMRTGEGKAVIRAGTSTVPAVLKKTSRAIKNSL